MKKTAAAIFALMILMFSLSALALGHKLTAEEAKQKAAEEKENFFKETIVKLTQRVSALEAVIKSKFEKEKMA